MCWELASALRNKHTPPHPQEGKEGGQPDHLGEKIARNRKSQRRPRVTLRSLPRATSNKWETAKASGRGQTLLQGALGSVKLPRSSNGERHE